MGAADGSLGCADGPWVAAASDDTWAVAKAWAGIDQLRWAVSLVATAKIDYVIVRGEVAVVITTLVSF